MTIGPRSKYYESQRIRLHYVVYGDEGVGVAGMDGKAVKAGEVQELAVVFNRGRSSYDDAL